MARQKKDSRNLMELAECKVNNPALVKQLETLGFKSADGGDMTFKEVIQCAQLASAVKGDLKAYLAVMEYMDKPSETSPLEQYLKDNGNYG